jgi:hypothetical protein
VKAVAELVLFGVNLKDPFCGMSFIPGCSETVKNPLCDALTPACNETIDDYSGLLPMSAALVLDTTAAVTIDQPALCRGQLGTTTLEYEVTQGLTLELAVQLGRLKLPELLQPGSLRDMLRDRGTGGSVLSVLKDTSLWGRAWLLSKLAHWVGELPNSLLLSRLAGDTTIQLVPPGRCAWPLCSGSMTFVQGGTYRARVPTFWTPCFVNGSGMYVR